MGSLRGPGVLCQSPIFIFSSSDIASHFKRAARISARNSSMGFRADRLPRGGRDTAVSFGLKDSAATRKGNRFSARSQ